jgi:hypothetical protein
MHGWAALRTQAHGAGTTVTLHSPLCVLYTTAGSAETRKDTDNGHCLQSAAGKCCTNAQRRAPLLPVVQAPRRRRRLLRGGVGGAFELGTACCSGADRACAAPEAPCCRSAVVAALSRAGRSGNRTRGEGDRSSTWRPACGCKPPTVKSCEVNGAVLDWTICIRSAVESKQSPAADAGAHAVSSSHAPALSRAAFRRSQSAPAAADSVSCTAHRTHSLHPIPPNHHMRRASEGALTLQPP